jgi:hypothetical protein
MSFLSSRSSVLIFSTALMVWGISINSLAQNAEKAKKTDQATTAPAARAAKLPAIKPKMTENEKIEYLLQFTGQSGLTFIRSGTEYSSKKAEEHLRGKWDYARKRIKTARDFIKYLASSSSMSGKPYTIKQKDGVLVPSGEWLAKALDELEKKQGEMRPKKKEG